MTQHEDHIAVEAEAVLQEPETNEPEDAEAADVPVVPESFSVKDSETASWLVRRINEARSYRKQVARWAEREIRRAERDEEFLIFRFGRQLEQWVSEEMTKLRGRRRSICLPGGVTGYRTSPQKLVVVDEAALLKWAKAACPKAVVTVEQLRKSIVNDHFADTGELPDGVEVKPKQDAFFIR